MYPKQKLTDRTIKAIKPTDRDQWISDGEALYLRVRTSGVKSWVVRKKKAGKIENITLGRFPEMFLADARLEAAKLNPKTARLNLTFGDLLDEYYEEVIRHKYRRPKQVQQYIDRTSTALRATKLRDLSRAEVRHFLKRYANDNGPVGANRLMSIFKQACKFAVDAGYLEVSPIDGLSRRVVGGEESARDRVLTDSEIRAIWNTDAAHTPLLRFLLLTGQRIGEAQQATAARIVNSRWMIPAEHSKNKKAHWCALSTQALRVLEPLPQERKLLFGGISNTGVQSWLRRWCATQKMDPAFTPHDLRRTMATRMNDLGIAPHVVEKILNHQLQGVMAVYNRAEYETERVDAMQKWASELERILADRGT